ncbi:MAG: hypothetical protein ACSHX9_03370 [Luteolibacter sp.]
MSIHVEISDEARQKLAKEKRISTISSCIIAIMTLVLIALILGFFLLPNLGKDDTQIVTYKSNMTDEEEPQAEKVKTNVQRKPTAPSNAPVKTIVATTASATSIPTVDAVEAVESLEFGAGDDFGTGWGDGTGFGGGGAQTAFGRTGGGGLEGKLYDLKQTRSKRSNNNGEFFKSNRSIKGRESYMKSKYRDLANDRFSESSLRDFYQAKATLSFSHLVMAANTDAVVAPKSFSVEKEVEPSAWVVVYDGRISPHKPGEYQFVGTFDDILFVFVDEKMVLDASFRDDYSSFNQTNKSGAQMRKGKSLIEGEWVRLIEGSRVKIIVGESPGGEMGGGLFIREKGKKYRQANGGDVLPPFTTGGLTKEDIKKLKKIEIMGSGGDYPVEVDDVPIFPAINRR